MVDVVFPDEEEVIDYSEKVKQETADRLSEMAWIWDKVQEKLGNDKVCFNCKKEIPKGEKAIMLSVENTDAGLVAFVGLCTKCSEEYKKTDKNETEDKNAK